MAEQSTSQQEQQRLVDIILANVGTVICFRSGSPADERFVLPLFSLYIEQGEIANLPSYSFFARIAAVQPQEPMSGVTLLLDDPGSDEIASQVIAHSRRTYAKHITEQPNEQTKAYQANYTNKESDNSPHLRKKKVITKKQTSKGAVEL